MRNFYPLFFFAFFLMPAARSQARLVLNGAHLRIANGTSGTPAYLVIDNGNAAGISRTANGGLIISEGEFNKVKWNINSALAVGPDSNTFWFHLGTSTGLAWIPFKIEKTVAGTGSGNFTVSSWYTAANSTVPNGGYTVCPSENNAIDRFWVINVSGYGTNPTSDLWFYYYDNAAELDGIAEGDLQVQHGNIALTCPWDPPVGTVDAGNNFVRANGFVSFSPFALGNRNSPLPIELVSFTGECKAGNVSIHWETASEINNDFFSVERSSDGESFETIGTIKGAGNNNNFTGYDFNDSQVSHLPTGEQGSSAHPIFYRLKQTDFDGSFSYSPVIAVSNCSEENHDHISIFIGNNNEIILLVNASSEKQYNLFFYDNIGRKIQSEKINIDKGSSTKILTPKKLATGIYLVSLQNEEEVITQKIFLH